MCLCMSVYMYVLYTYVGVCFSLYKFSQEGKTPGRETQVYSYNGHILADKFTTLGSASVYI